MRSCICVCCTRNVAPTSQGCHAAEPEAECFFHRTRVAWNTLSPLAIAAARSGLSSNAASMIRRRLSSFSQGT